MQWPILISIGIGVGILGSFFGIGGGVILVPILLALGFQAEVAVGTGFVAIFLLSLSALLAHALQNNIEWRWGILLGVGTLLGAQIGTRLLGLVPTPLFKKLFALFLIAIALRLLFKP